MKRVVKNIVLIIVLSLFCSCDKKSYVIFDYNCNVLDYYKCELNNNKLNCDVETPTCREYVFKGWYRENDHENQVDLNGDFTANEIIYARWENEKGEIIEQSSQELVSTIITPTPIDQPSTSQIEYSSRIEYSSQEEPSSQKSNSTPVSEDTYSISFNLNGGIGGYPSTVSGIKYGSILPSISSVKPTKGGHIFEGWYDSKEGGKEYYNSSNSPVRKYDKKGNITLYAHWKACSKGQYAAAGSTSCSTCPENTYTNTTGQSSCKTCESGYKVNSTHTGCVITNTYTITFNLNGGTGEQYSQISGIKYDQTLPTLNNTKPTKGGHIFEGWYDSKDGGKEYYNSSNSPVRKYDKKSNITLYAHWKACSKGQYAPAGASSCSTCPENTYTNVTGQTSCKSCESGYTVNSSHTGCNKNTVTCPVGQYLPSGATSCSICPENTYTDTTGQTSCKTCATGYKVNSNHTGCIANIYTITLNNQSATSSGTASIYLKYNTGWYSNLDATTSITKITVPTKKGHAFGGYYTSKNGGGTQIIDATGKILSNKTSSFSSNTTLYAKWTPYILKMQYNGNGGTWNNPKKTTYGVNSSGTVVKSTGEVYEPQLKYGEQLESSGLIDFNGSWFSWKKTGNSVCVGKEYIIGTTVLDQTKVYKAEDLASYGGCDLSKKDCSVTIKVNWTTPIKIAGKKYHSRYEKVTGVKGYPQNFAIANFGKSSEILYVSAGEKGNISATGYTAAELAAVVTSVISKFTIDSNKKATYKSSMYLKNTGHGQPFDYDTARNIFITNDYSTTTTRDSRIYGTNTGIMGVSFSTVNKGGDFNKLFTYNLNASGAPTPIIDNENGVLAIRTATTFKLYDYDYNSLKNGKFDFNNYKLKLTIKRANPTTHSDGKKMSLQGFALYNGFIYELTGDPGKDAYIEAFDFLGNSVYKVKLANGYTTTNAREPEGIKVYSNKIYFMTTYAINYVRMVDVGYYE